MANEANKAIAMPATIPLKEIKGEVELTPIQFPKDLGEEHPFSFENCEKVYTQVGIARAAIDKHLDFIVSPGFFVTSKTKKAEVIINQFIRDTNFSVLLRDWILEGMVKGNGFLEIGESKNQLQLKVINANRMYVRRNNKGQIEGYNQYIGENTFDPKKIIPFKASEIAHLQITSVGDSAYGIGLMFPALKIIDNLWNAEKDMHMLIRRKANSPIVASVGDENNPPTQADIDNVGRRFEWLNNYHEWSVDYRTKFSVLDFGNLAEKFATVLEHDRDMIFYAFQVPSVLMGTGNIPEGLAKVQLDAFERRVQSLQANIEKIVEEKIFKRILEINGLDAEIEMEWGLPSEESINKRVERLTLLLQNPMLSPQMRAMLELDLAENLGFEEAKKFLAKPQDVNEREEEENELTQPEVPGEKNESFDKKLVEKYQDYELKEWLGFNYEDFRKDIISFIKKDDFEDLLATSKLDKELGLLTKSEINKLKNVLIDDFKKGASINKIAQDIRRLNLPERKGVNKEGKKFVELTKDERALVIARTETTRTAGMGALENYEKRGVEKVRWIAAISDRTCPICIRLDGRVVEIKESFEDNISGFEGLSPPAHTMCRCSLGAVTELEAL